MSEGKELDHEYDGIKELDNQLPKWWLTIFYITIIWAGSYWIYYEFGGGANQGEELALDMKEIEALKAASKEKSTDEAPVDLNSLIGNQQAILGGKKEFDSKCASCHGNLGQGVIGPNLTDTFWLHGDGKIASIVAIIKEGVPAKGMPPWGPVIAEPKINEIAAYILSLKGSAPKNAKAPQGKEFK